MQERTDKLTLHMKLENSVHKLNFFLFYLVLLATQATASANLEYKEIERVDERCQRRSVGCLVTTASRDQEPYILQVCSLADHWRWEGLILDAQGQLMDPISEEPLTFNFDNLARGELVCFKLESKGHHRGSMVLIPFPIERMDARGHRLLMIRGDRCGNFFRLRGSGYQSGEELQLIVSQGRDRWVTEGIANSDGCFEIPLNFATIGQTGGTAVIVVKGSGSRVSLACDWGAQLFARG